MKIKISLVALFLISSLHAITLSEAVKNGIESDPEISAQVAKYDGKKLSISIAKAGYYPKIDLSAGIGFEETDRENPHSQQTNENMTRKDASARLRQPIFEGFTTSSSVSSSSADKEAAGYELYKLVEDKALQIIKAYSDVLKSQKIVELAENNLEDHNKILSSIEQRYNQGITDKADLLQIKGRVAGAKSDLLAAKNNALDAEAAYIKTVGKEAQGLQKITFDDMTLPSSLEEAIKLSKEKNPAMLAARKNIQSVRSRLDGSDSGYYPHLYGDLSADYKNDADGVQGRQDTYQAMLRLEWNIFNGFRESNQNEIVQKEVFSAEQNAQETEHQLVLETTLSWNAFMLLKQQLEPLKEHVLYAEEVKSLYKQQYNVGKRTLVDVLNSQVEQFNASKTLIAAQYDENVAKYRILNSLGTLSEILGIRVYK